MTLLWAGWWILGWQRGKVIVGLVKTLKLRRDKSARTEYILSLKYFLPGLCEFSKILKISCSKTNQKK